VYFFQIVHQASEVIEMNHYSSKIGIIFLSFQLLSTAQAADIKDGKKQSMLCVGCHGNAGVSQSSMFPSLAGQSNAYLETQLKNFRAGTRENSTMNGIAKALKDDEINNLSAYFSSLPGKSAGGDSNLAKIGKQKVGMCMGCHGNTLQGNGQFPKLAGQHPDYISKQLSDFKSGGRKAGHMNAVAKSLSDDDIKAISAYLGSL